MSLPPATRDISTNPAKGSVTVPNNAANKQADVERKFKLYGVISAFRQGKMPNNEQIDETLRYVLDHSPIPQNELSPEGRALIQDTKDIIATARLMVQEKNADELFQNFVWNTRNVDTNSLTGGRDSGDLKDEVAPVDKEKVVQDKDQAVKHLRTLLSLVLTNSEVRKLLSDFSVIGRDLLSRGAVKAAQAVAPPEDELRRVDQSAPNDQFITEGGRVAGPNETPVLEARIPGTGSGFKAGKDGEEIEERRLRMHPHDDQPQLVNPDGSKRGLGDMRDDAYAKRDQAIGQGVDAAQDPNQRQGMMGQAQQAKDQVKGEAMQRKAEYDEADPEEKEETKKGVMNKLRGFRDNVRENISSAIPDKHKDRAAEQKDRAHQFFTEEYFPEERRDQFIFRGKKVIIECQKHDDYQESVRWLLGLIEEYAGHGKTVGGKGTDIAGDVTNHPGVSLATRQLRTLLERFANNTSLDLVFNAFQALADDASRDEGLRTWFKAVDLYIRKVLLEPGYVLEPDCNTQANRLTDLGREYYDVKYKMHFDNLFDSTSQWFKAMGDDPINQQFGEDWARLTRDLLFDSEGALKFKPELWNDIRRVILPTLIEQVGYIPIPRIEYTDEGLDLVVENLTLQGRNLFPNIVAIDAMNHLKFSPYSAIDDDRRTHMKLELKQMQADMRDVAFYYRKKTGIKVKDRGVADVLLGGEGLSATIELVNTKRDKSSVFKVHAVNVKVDTLKFAIRDSNHDFLYKTLRPLATGLIKKQIEKAMKDALTTGFEYLDGQLVAVRDRMDAAKATDGETRTGVLKDLFQRKKQEVEVKSAKSDSQFKIVADKRDSLLPQEAGHPGGWANKTTEAEAKANVGSEWRSEAFKIV
jgi:hypothetical protein